MKTADPTLIAYLQQCIDLGVTEIPHCELFTLTLTCGDVLTYTDWDGDVIVGGTRFIGTGLVIPQRGNLKSKIGTEVDEMQLDFHLGQDDNGNFASVLRGMTMQALAAAGWLDQASVLVQRLFWQQVGSLLIAPWGPVWKFSGLVSKPGEISHMLVSLDVLAWTQRLQRQVPNTRMQPGCPYQVFDPRCGVNAATYAVNCAAAAGSTPVLLKAAALNKPDAWFDNGYLVFTSGANQGLAASIKSYALANGIQLDAPLLAPLAVGDTFTAYPGCDYTAATCAAKFANASRYAGWDFVPTPETAF
jgi:uncharacterized phage protein (TIGR02218 family)